MPLTQQQSLSSSYNIQPGLPSTSYTARKHVIYKKKTVAQHGNGFAEMPSMAPVADTINREPCLITTQRGITNLKPPIPDCPCERCGGLGRSLCGVCRGKGRLNFRSEAMLPKGAAPVWCRSCRASGKWYCEMCMGTGVKREPIGFRV